MSIPDRAVYATQPQLLTNQIADLLKHAQPPGVDGEVQAVIVPASNRLEGGKVAADVFKTLDGETYDAVILIAPSHIGAFRRMNICSVDVYHTALGDLQVNDQLRNELCDEDDDIFLDDAGHYHTEGIDVQLPYLQLVLREGFEIVPIIMGDESPEFCRELANAVGEMMYNRRTLLVASADVVEASEEGLQKLEEYLQAGDVSRLMGLLNSEEVQMEGKGAVVVALLAAQHRRASEVTVVRTQAPSTGRPGYAGALLWRK